MITDRKGNVWDTRLTYASIKRIRSWEIVDSRMEYSETSPPELKEFKRPLGIDLLYLNDLVAMQFSPSEEIEALAAWLFPQWDGKMSREDFDDLMEPGLKEELIAALQEGAKSFFTGQGGKEAIEHLNTLEVEMIKKIGRDLRAKVSGNSSSDGTNTPESSDSAPKSTT